MNGKLPMSSKGLRMLFFAQIIGIVSIVLTIIPPLAMAGSLATLALSIYGLSVASNDHPDYKRALYCAVVGVVLSIFAMMPGGFLRGINFLLDFAMVYFVCRATSALLTEIGEVGKASRGKLVMQIYFGCTLIGVASSVLLLIPFLNVFAGMALIVLGVAQVAAYILYLLFLQKAYVALGAA